jgi:hypothetical protein
MKKQLGHFSSSLTLLAHLGLSLLAGSRRDLLVISAYTFIHIASSQDEIRHCWNAWRRHLLADLVSDLVVADLALH